MVGFVGILSIQQPSEYRTPENRIHLNTGHMACPDFKWHIDICGLKPFENRTKMSGFQMVWTLGPHMSKYHSKTGLFCPNFKWPLKTGPFNNRTHLDHLNTGLVRYSDDNCSPEKQNKTGVGEPRTK